MFAHDQVGFAQSYIFGTHNLKGLGIFQHSVLVNAALMSKGIFTDDGFVKLHRKAGHRGHAAANGHYFCAVDLCAVGHDVVAHFHSHHDLFQCRVASALPQAIDCALNLTCAGIDGGQGIGGGHAKIIVAMRGENHLCSAGHVFN